MANPGAGRAYWICSSSAQAVDRRWAFYLAEESHRRGVKAVQSPRGRKGTGTCGFRRTQLEGGATVHGRLVRRRFAEQRPEPGRLGEMAAGGAGARGADHGMPKVRHFERKMKKGLESL